MVSSNCVLGTGQGAALQRADTAIQAAMHSIGSGGGAAVLQHYRYDAHVPSDLDYRLHA